MARKTHKESPYERMRKLSQEIERHAVILNEYSQSDLIRDYERHRKAKNRKQNKLKWLRRWHGIQF